MSEPSAPQAHKVQRSSETLLLTAAVSAAGTTAGSGLETAHASVGQPLRRRSVRRFDALLHERAAHARGRRASGGQNAV